MKKINTLITIGVMYVILSIGWIYIQKRQMDTMEIYIVQTQTLIQKYQKNIDLLIKDTCSLKKNIARFIETKDDFSTYLNSPIINDIQITPDFNLREFCDKRTGEVKICPRLIYICQKLRNRAGYLLVSSGYRTEMTNKEIGGSKTSLHLKGMAVDLVPRDISIKELADIAKQFPEIIEIGIYQKHLHIGIGEGERRIWYSDAP